MSWWSHFFHRKTIGRDDVLAEIAAQNNSLSGVGVTTLKALQVSTVLACARVIAEGIAQPPFKVMRALGKMREPARDHPLYEVLASRPNPWQTSFEFREMLGLHAVLCGNFFAFINRSVKGQRVLELLPIESGKVRVEQVSDWTSVYHIRSKGGEEKAYPAEAIWHVRGPSWNGYLGLDAVSLAREAIGLAMATESQHSKLHKHGTSVSGLISVEGNLTDVQYQQMRRWLEENFEGPKAKRAGGNMILDRSSKFTQMQMSGVDAQHLECVAPGTLISMSDGTRKVAEDVRAGDWVMGWGNDGLTKARVAFVGTPPIKRLVRVTTNRGRVLTCSSDHPILAKRALRTAGSRPCGAPPEWIHAGDLEAGAYVRTALGHLETKPAAPMDSDTAWFLGAMVGDGYIRKGQCSLSATEPAVIGRAREFVEAGGGWLTQSRSRPQDFGISTGGNGKRAGVARRLFNEAGLVGSRSGDKRVPQNVMAGGPKAWAGFLSGYLDTDGTVARPGAKTFLVSWSSINRDLLEDCQHLLALLGVQSAIYRADTAKRRTVVGQECDAQDVWALVVYGASELRKVAALLAPSHAEKSRRLALYRDLPASNYRENNFLFDRVVSVEALGSGETIGIEIEGVHTHVTNGIVTHNTRRYQVEEICRFMRVMPIMVGFSDKATTYASAEQMFLAHVVHTLAPWWTRIEQSVDARLLTEKDRADGYYADFTEEGMLRGAAKDTKDVLIGYVNGGLMTANEGRGKLDLNPDPDPASDKLRVPANIVGEQEKPEPEPDSEREK